MEIIYSPPKSMAAHQLRATCMCLTFSIIWLQLAMVSPVCGASLRVQKHLKRFNKPAISTIESPDGDMIDCILMSQQPAFDHPLLKDHKIQMQANYPEGLSEFKAAKESSVYSFLGDENVAEEQKPQQLWHDVGVSCPQGTIPIRRTTERDLLRVKRMDKYGRKFHLPPKPSAAPSAAAASLADESAHQHAIAYVQGGAYYGAKANINVWNPSVQVSNEFSLSQLWILGGSFNTNLNSIEAGWQVSPDLYGDNNTRLFIYWTSDAYQATGCYNLLCSGFVQVSDQIAIGATISPVSTYGNSQYDITILIWKDPKQGNWWMQFGNKYLLGYWPAALFTTLSKSASMVEWGGEVVNSEPGGQHTATQMGSGHFPSEAFGKSSYFSHLQVVDANNNLLSSGDVSTFAERPACYDVQSSSSSDWGNYFYYGGPGRNPNCL